MTDVIFVSTGTGERQRVAGMVHTNKLLPTDTGGAFAAIEIAVPPGAGAPPHRHARDGEAFFVLSGELTFEHGGGEAITGRAGDLCWLPAGSSHAFRNDGSETARALVITSPGAEAVRFFTEVDAIGGPPEPEAMMSIAARNGIELLETV